jgi:general secretion pathway protein C
VERIGSRAANARGTITRCRQGVNSITQRDARRNLNCGRDLPNVREVRAELGLDRAVNIARGLLIAASACGAALVIGAAAKFWLDASTTAGARVSPRAQTDGAVQTRRGPLDYAAIFERNLFGSEPISDTAAASPGGRDELLLRGTAEFAGRGYAVLEDPDSGKQGIFEVGELAFDGPKLVAVEPLSATILRGNRRIVLEITETDRGATTSGATAPSAAGAGIRPVGDNRYVVDRDEVDHSIENLSQVVTQMRAVPYLKDGKSVGFRVFNIRAGSLFERMGLKNGDIIQSVNGSQLDDPSRALALLDEVQTSDEIRIDLLRDDSPNTLTYSIR